MYGMETHVIEKENLSRRVYCTSQRDACLKNMSEKVLRILYRHSTFCPPLATQIFSNQARQILVEILTSMSNPSRQLPFGLQRSTRRGLASIHIAR